MRKTIIIFACSSLFILLMSCNLNFIKKEDISEKEIKLFEYSYGSFFGGYYEYSISSEDKKMIFKAKGMNGVDLDIEKEITKDEIDDLLKLIVEEDLNSWNGFDKSDEDILDGYSFSLNIKFEDEYIIKAFGYEKYPENYDKRHEKIEKYLNELVEKYK
jgi:hypothetical protein